MSPPGRPKGEYRSAQREGNLMYAPHPSPFPFPGCPAAANRSAPRTHSSCSPRSTRWPARGKDIVSFCIGQPDFPTPANIQDAAIAAIRGGKHGYTPSAGIDELRAAAARDLGGRRGLDIRPDDVVVARGREAVHRVHDRVGDRLRRRRRGDLSGAGLSDLRVADHRQRRGSGADLPARSARFRVRPGRARGEDHAEDAPADPQFAAESDRRRPVRSRSRCDRRDSSVAIRRSGCSPTRSIPGSSTTAASTSLAKRDGMLERTVICDGASKTWAMTGWRLGYVANRALAPAFTRWITNTESCASQISQWAAVEAINGPQDSVAEMHARFRERRDLIVGLLNAVPGITCKTSGRRVLRVAERHRGVPDRRRRRFRGVSQAPAARGGHRRARRHSFRPPRARATASTSAFRTRRRREAIENGIARLDAFVRKHRRRACDGDRRQQAVARSGARARARGARPAWARRRCARRRACVHRGATRPGPRPAALPRPRAAVPPPRDRHVEHRRAGRATTDDIPPAVARYLAAIDPVLAADTGVCWPEFADARLDAGGRVDRIAAHGRARRGWASPAASARSPRPARWCS